MKKVYEYLKEINSLYLYGIIVMLIIICVVLTALFITKKKIVTKTVNLVSNNEKKENIVSNLVKVDIKGNVVNQGVYELDENSRVIDVINLAGGLLEDSNTNYINLSQKINDQMTIVIYSNEQIKEFEESNRQKDVKVVSINSCPDTINDACISKNNNLKENNKVVTNLSKEQEEVIIDLDKKTNDVKENQTMDDKENANENKCPLSINIATIEELQTLSGVGESKAESIIEYREKNGNFSNIEEIKNVNGIGEALFEKIKDCITV